MTETSIAKPLSGPECLDSCLDALRKALSKDDRFSSHMAYSGFRAIIQFKFYPQLSFVPAIERGLTVEEGEHNDIAESPTVDETVELPLRPPNQVREEAKLAQPILVSDGQGRSHEEWVKRDGPVPKQSVVPKKNVVKGA